MASRQKTPRRGGPADPLAGRTYPDYRGVFNAIFSAAGEGRMTLEVIKEISATLQRFFKCRTAEIVYREKGKLLHAKAVTGRPPATSGWKDKSWGDPPFLDLFESVDPESVARLKSLTRAKNRGRGQAQLVFTVPSHPAPWGEKPRDDTLGHAFLLIPSGEAIGGALALHFLKERRVDEASLELLSRLATIIGVSLSHNLSRFELRERVKELTCMYSIANLAVISHQQIEAFLQQAVELLPAAYLHPEITAARILLEGKTYQTPGFVESPQSQSARIVVGGHERGLVEVVYREPRPELDEGPFLAEERHLLDSVARELASIIERRQAESEQARLMEQLRHADRLATIGKLAAGVAHELNEPLTGILGFSELLKEIPGMPAQAESDLARIESAALHAREVVRQLLLFARQISPKQGKVGVNRLILEVVGFFRARLGQQGIKVRTELAEKLPDILADESQIRQILTNLTVNAIHAMEKGGLLTIATQSRGEEIELCIHDTGPGIPDDIKDKIFLPFFTTKDVDMGTGLGLAVVHGIVKSHGGRIKARSEAGKGAEFRVCLPVKPEAPR
jgi:signal transduction histidine kinase